MTGGESPRAIRGRSVRTLPRFQKDFDDGVTRVCPRCGTGLSRYNDGPLCHSCHDRHGVPKMPIVRGRVTD